MESSDDTIRSLVVEALSRDSRLNSACITVVVENGVVILDGDAPALYTLQVAVELAACVPGIRSLHNRLRVKCPAQSPADTVIKNCADQIMRWNASLGAARIRVGVNAGTVTLEGEVDAYWKCGRAERLMHDIQGVTAVSNRLVVVPELVPQDRVIAEDVKSAIERCISIGQDSIVVEVDHGMVTLTGRVPSLWSKHTTPALAGSILGVTGVIDNLVVSAAE